MSLFKPFGFYKQQVAAEPAWTPANFENIQYWWRADLGITESGGNVTVWEDQINSHQLIQSFNSNPSYTAAERSPSLSTSTNLNSQPTVLFETKANATYGTVGEYLYGSTAPAINTAGDDICYLFVMDYIGSPAVNPGGSFFGTGTTQNINSRYWIDKYNSGGDYRLANQLGGGAVKVADTGVPVSTGATAIFTYYWPSAGWTYLYLNSVTGGVPYITNGGTNGVFDSSTRFNLGSILSTSTGGANLRFEDFHMAEMVVLYDINTSTFQDELYSWQAYVNNRYGTIIS